MAKKTVASGGDLRNQDMASLRNRLTLARAVVKMCREDPKMHDQLPNYQEQLNNIEKEIKRRTGKMPAVTVGLKTASLTAKVPK